MAHIMLGTCNRPDVYVAIQPVLFPVVFVSHKTGSVRYSGDGTFLNYISLLSGCKY